MDDADILGTVRELVDEERALRVNAGAGAIDFEEEHQRLGGLSNRWTNAGTYYASGKPAARQAKI
jgi:Protein of unknown function (DUF2630)